MAIIAENSGNGENYVPVDAGTYMARCFSMVHIGTVEMTWEGQVKHLNKVRLSWELPTELKEFKEGEGEKPYVISKEYTLSMHEKANLRKTLESWRGAPFTEDQAKAFDVTKLLGVECMLSIIHSVPKADGRTYANISSIAKLMKGSVCPEQISPRFEFSYDQPTAELLEKFESFPDFLKDKIKSTPEWKKAQMPETTEVADEDEKETDDLPF